MLSSGRTNKVLKALAVAGLVLVVGACSSKKKNTDAENAAPEASQTAPQIDSTPMSFDAAGSDSGKIAGLSTVNFPYDKAILSPEAKQKLQANADWMKSHANVNIQIEGHCDARGSIEYNLSLGERRAKAVKSYMTGLGVGANRLSIISYGKEKLLTTGETEADHARNRRANFVPLN